MEVRDRTDAMVAAQAQAGAIRLQLTQLAAQHGFTLEGPPPTDVMQGYLSTIAQVSMPCQPGPSQSLAAHRTRFVAQRSA